MSFSVNEFVAALRLDGSRSNYFQVDVTNPVAGGADNILPFMCRAASIPASQVNVLKQHYMGRTLKFAGVRPEFPNWDVTIVNDEDYIVRNALETWHNYINGLRTNIRKFPTSSPQEYKSVARITQFGKTGDVMRVYQFFGIFPETIGGIGKDFRTDEIDEFPVSFAYDYWEVIEGITGNAGGA